MFEEAVQNDSLDQQLDQAFSEASTDNQQAPVADTPAAEPQRYKYSAIGKEIEEPIDVILKRASMGYDYAQKMHNFKTEQEQWRQQVDEAKRLQETYGPIDTFARQNPGYNEFLQEQWNNRSTWNNGVTDNQPSSEVMALKGEITSLRQQLGEVTNFVQGERQAKEDAVLGAQVKEISEKYPQFDLRATRPDDGRSREMDVLEHMQRTGINDFRTAFRDLYHDDIIRSEVERVLKGKVESTANDRRQGIIGRSPTPVLNSPADISRLSESQLLDAMVNDPIWEGGR